MSFTTTLLRNEYSDEGQRGAAQMQVRASHQDIGLPGKQGRDFHDASSLASANSTTSDPSSVDSCFLKERLSRCLEQYQALVRDSSNPNSTKEAVFWCCLGLAVAVACTPISPAQRQSPLSDGSRSGSSNSLVSDSGFAPSVEINPRHRLSLGDPGVENLMTNLVGGLGGAFAARLLDHDGVSCDLVLPNVDQGFNSALSQLDLSANQNIDNIAALAAKIAAQLLHVLRSDCDSLRSPAMSYWELCLKLVIASNEDDINTSNDLRSQLIKHAPPPSLVEPALSFITSPLLYNEPTGPLPFPTLERSPKLHIATRLRRQTRSRAASLMSHASLRSFSSIRSLGALSPKSPASLSLSHDFGAAYSPGGSPSPSGSFIMEPSVTALGTLDSIARALQVQPRRRSSLRQPLVPNNDYSFTETDSPRRSTLARSSSDYMTDSRVERPLFSGRSKGKGKELPREGLRPGVANISVRTGTRFAMTSPPTPVGLGHTVGLPKMDPVLAALEKSSKFKSRSLCLNCGKKGDNYPCCPRCGEAWCSRECRIEANNGGKHVCKRASSLSP